MKFELSNDYVLAYITNVMHYTKQLFSFKAIKPSNFRFEAGQFVMIGLIIRGKFIFRAYSICGAIRANELEFYSIKVPNGTFTSFLQKISVNISSIIIKLKPTGTLIINALKPGKRLFLLSTGTGIAPFVSIIYNPEVYKRYNEVIVVQTCRYPDELQYFNNKLNQLIQTLSMKRCIKNKLRFYLSITRMQYPYIGRITDLIKSGLLITDLRTWQFNNADKFMICGSHQMTIDISFLLNALGYKEGSTCCPQDFVYEKSFAS